MLSVLGQARVRPLYGMEAFRKSRSMAGGFVLLALSLALMFPAVQPITPPKSSPAVILMRVVHPLPTPQPKVVPPDDFRKLLSSESDVTIPVPPLIEQPKKMFPVEAAKTVVSAPVKAKSVQKVSPVRKRTPVTRQWQEQPQSLSVPEVKVETPASVAVSGSHAPAVNAQDRVDDRSTVLAVVLEALNRHKRYPKQARRLGAEGTVQLLVIVGAEGKIQACRLGKSSGHSVLDAATARLGEKLVGLEVPAQGGKSFQILIPVRYSLKDA